MEESTREWYSRTLDCVRGSTWSAVQGRFPRDALARTLWSLAGSAAQARALCPSPPPPSAEEEFLHRTNDALERALEDLEAANAMASVADEGLPVAPRRARLTKVLEAYACGPTSDSADLARRISIHLFLMLRTQADMARDNPLVALSRSVMPQSTAMTHAPWAREEIAALQPEVGMRVTRGPDWKWGGQDGGPGCVGEVLELAKWGRRPTGGVRVRWESTKAVRPAIVAAARTVRLWLRLPVDDPAPPPPRSTSIAGG